MKALERIGFDPQALTSLTVFKFYIAQPGNVFRSTGSYEPDRKVLKCTMHGFLVSIHRLLRA